MRDAVGFSGKLFAVRFPMEVPASTLFTISAYGSVAFTLLIILHDEVKPSLFINSVWDFPLYHISFL
jgi:hypothetical protein